MGYQMRFKLKALWNHWTIQDFNKYSGIAGPSWRVITKLLNRQKPMEELHFQVLAHHLFEVILTKLVVIHHCVWTEIIKDQVDEELSRILDSHIIPEEWYSSLLSEFDRQYLNYCNEVQLMIDGEYYEDEYYGGELRGYIVPTYLNYMV